MIYEEEISTWRMKREKDLREGIKIGELLWSPVPEEERKNLKLNFYEIDDSLKFEARVVFSVSEKERTFLNEDGSSSQVFHETGRVEFEHNNEKIRLFFIYDKQTNGYYIGFRDTTCEKESYPNGRLILIEDINQEDFFLDFNKAFNFACAYNETLTCPIVPKENWLSFAVKAGEKKYKIKHT